MKKEYIYYFDKEKKQYSSEEILRKALKSKVCKVGKHDWRVTWVFGVKKCEVCKVKREVA